MTADALHERFEVLVMKATDKMIDGPEQQELDAHVLGCADCAAELRDFGLIKVATDALAARLRSTARIAPPRPRQAERTITTVALLAILVGALMLMGFGIRMYWIDMTIPTIVKLGSTLVGGGLAVLMSMLVFGRIRDAGKDPYKEVDR